MQHTICVQYFLHVVAYCLHIKHIFIIWFATFWGMRVENPSLYVIVLKHFRQFKEKQWPGTFEILAPRLYNRYNHAHVPDPHM